MLSLQGQIVGGTAAGPLAALYWISILREVSHNFWSSWGRRYFQELILIIRHCFCASSFGPCNRE